MSDNTSLNLFRSIHKTTPGYDATPGPVSGTGRNLDVAMKGNAWLAVQGLDAIRRFLRTHLGGHITIDVTHKQLAGDSVTWSARWHPRPSAPPSRGEIEARYRGDRVAELRLSGAH